MMKNFFVEEIEIDVPPERVYSAWTDPKQLAEWWGDDQTYHTTEVEADLRCGGRWISRGKGADGKPFSVRGEYIRIEPPHYLSFTWIPDWDGSGKTVVDLEFISRDSGTLLRLTHSAFTNEQSRDSHAKGWLRVFGWMKQYVEARLESRKAELQSQG